MIDSQFINCTPHDIVLFQDDGPMKLYPASGKVIRLLPQPQRSLPFQHMKVPVVSRQVFTDLEGLCDVPRGSAILVSAAVGERLATMADKVHCWVFGPDTGPEAAVRDSAGKMRGTTRFILYAAPSNIKYECPICGERDLPQGCCLQCGTDLSEECYSIPATSLHIVDGKLVRRVIVDPSVATTFRLENK